MAPDTGRIKNRAGFASVAREWDRRALTGVVHSATLHIPARTEGAVPHTRGVMQARRRRDLLTIVALAAVYVAAGRLGLQLDAVGGFATLVWAPTGIALAALLAGGMRLWPGVAAGAFLVNVWAGATIPLALAIALGNTLEAVTAAYALGRIRGFDPSLRRARDAFALIVIGALLSTLLSATIGASSLRLAGVITPERFGATWLAWWIGDAIGDLIVAPLLLCWLTVSHGISRPRTAEAFLLMVALGGAAVLVFGAPAPTGAAGFIQPYLLSPFLIWAALRFRQRGATAAIFLVSVIAIWGTALGLGPFNGGPLHERLSVLQAFLAILAVTFLMLGAVAAERATALRELTVARDASEAASRAKSRFLAVVSHELRTPLNGIIGYADLLLDNVAGTMVEQQHGYVSRIRSAAWHLVSVIEGILTFARGDVGQHDLRLEPSDATSLVRDAVALLAPYVAAKQLDVQVSVPDEAVAMLTDPGKVRQILVNLLGNAVKFTTAPAIEMGCRRDDGWVTFHVRDHGPGIPSDQLERIFEPFAQVGGNNAQLTAGTGLGLPVSRMLAELLGGTVTVTSRLGEGSTFNVRLPATTSAAPPPSMQPAAPAPQHHTSRT
jgi:signal transduction histidine kinase